MPRSSLRIRILLLLALAVLSAYFLASSASHYVEVYRAIYSVKVSVLSIIYNVDFGKRVGRVNIIIKIENPSNREVEFIGGEGKIYLNGKYLGSLMFYAGEGVPVPPKAINFTITGIASIPDPYFRILEYAIDKGEFNWLVEAWIHFKIDIHVTIVKCYGEL